MDNNTLSKDNSNNNNSNNEGRILLSIIIIINNVFIVLAVAQENEVQLIKLPKKMRKRGRPKGAGLTVVGLPKKKVCAGTTPKPFLNRSEWEKAKGIML